MLTDPRAEAFAVAWARGVNPENANELARFAGDQGYASRFAERPKVAAKKPANRPNKPETARYRPDFAALDRRVGEDADRPAVSSPRLSSAPASPTSEPLSGR